MDYIHTPQDSKGLFRRISRIKHKKEKERGEEEQKSVAVAATNAALLDKEVRDMQHVQNSSQQEQQHNKEQKQSTKKTRSYSKAVAAYRLFSKGKKAVEVAICLK